MAEATVLARRRRWTAEEKVALLAEVDAAGGKVPVVAERYGVPRSLIYNWRAAQKAAASFRSEAPLEFLTLGTVPESEGPPPGSEAVVPGERDRAGLIEVELPSGVRLRVDALVNEKALSRVVRVLKVAF
ncbi:transposase [Nitrospirillum sp. BR 11164]|uniref:IS66-like element accessory protein TnpA n=1 Tax=Nitrospirillum sp. BR 11164 TaxID=3104324 RepID=UPI002B003E2B|nr:transposase [Nitrospirillum sp. BR 11164]MEA1649023.1 transposase [Nitrospirillum sp. BR 11164]